MESDKLRIFTVLKSGGEYGVGHVAKIRDMLKKHVTLDYEFICLTDTPELMEDGVSLVKGWQGWWSKIELFAHEGPALFFDLDTIITSNIDGIIEMCKGESFCALNGFYKPSKLQSSMMYWEGDWSEIYDEFSKDPEKYILENKSDQDFIHKIVGDFKSFQNMTNEIASYKATLNYGRLFDGEKIIIFHGVPRPWQQNVIHY